MTSRPLYILGTSGLAREMALLVGAVDQSDWVLAGFIGADRSEVGKDLGFAAVVGDDAWLLEHESDCGIVMGVGFPAVKERVLARFLAEGERYAYPNFIHPTAVLDRTLVKLGRGNMVTAGCIFTTDIEVADFNLFNLQTTVGHDARIGSGCVFNPSVNISGGVTIRDRVLVGTGAQILENRTVSDGATIGAGAVVVQDVLAGETVVGIPARPLARRT